MRSQRLDVAVKREGKIWEMSFRRGEPGVYKDSKAPSPDATFTLFTTQSELRITGKVAKKVTGTRVRYWADPEIFPRDSHFNYDHLIERVREKAFLVPGIEIVVRDERGLPGTPGEAGPVEEVFKYDGEWLISSITWPPIQQLRVLCA